MSNSKTSQRYLQYKKKSFAWIFRSTTWLLIVNLKPNWSDQLQSSTSKKYSQMSIVKNNSLSYFQTPEHSLRRSTSSTLFILSFFDDFDLFRNGRNSQNKLTHSINGCIDFIMTRCRNLQKRLPLPLLSLLFCWI